MGLCGVSLRILGVDPGSQIAGFGLIDLKAGQLHYVEHGLIRLKSSLDFADRILALGHELASILKRHNPQMVAIEKAFLGKNVDSAFKLGHARGVCIYEVSKHGALLAEYAPREIKKGITGNGASEKEQVATCVWALLGLQPIESSKFDATDALAMAIHHAHVVEQNSRLDPRRFLDR